MAQIPLDANNDIYGPSFRRIAHWIIGVDASRALAAGYKPATRPTTAPRTPADL
jgi:hypothetical protein